ncbi:hypothetical protein LCGC14_1456110 [marine sediment metagenome]|uniref:Zinc-ribbon domain-containing protein n=1 Tax=marine sediment metagenome TaxID=412755 RepID=A0A0F9JH69_9ZZZZ|nr:hypothetical protein [archaeon]
MLNEDIKNIGITNKRVLLESEEVRKVITLLKTKKGMSQKDISDSIGFLIGDVLNHGYSLPYESFKKLQQLAGEIHLLLHIIKIKWRKSYNTHSMEQLAQIVGIKKTGVAGKFLSKKYNGMNSLSEWQCGKCGRIWKTQPNVILYQKRWCIHCSGRETWTYVQMVELGQKRGLEKTGIQGQFLTTKADYEAQPHPDMSKYQWKCGKCGHVWEATANNVKRGSWCRKCQYAQLSHDNRTPYPEIVLLAKTIGKIKTGYEGKFMVSKEEYMKAKDPSHHKFKWKCGKCTSIFEMDITHARRPQWCPKCAEGEGEQVCRGFFEHIFKAQFPKLRPEWLVNTFSGGQMHFDGYNKQLKLAFEFNGPQHYVFYPKYHKKYEDFIKQKERDMIKAELCKKNGITLIFVPHTLEYDEFQDYIIEEYRKLTGKEVKNKEKYNWRMFNQDKTRLTDFF